MSPRAAQVLQDRGLEADVAVGLERDALIERLQGARGLIVRSSTKVTEAVIAGAPDLAVVGRAGIGVDNIDVAAATSRGVIVMNTPFGNAVTTAEHAVAMLMAAARRIPAANASTQAGKWEKSRFLGVELMGKTLGVIGCGNIGSIVASRAQGLRMKVIAYDPYLTPERAVELGVEKVDLDALLARADAITLHTPLTEKTRNVLSREAIGRTKKGVLIVNCARGGLVDEAALADALDEGHVGAAAIDVFVEEPATDNVLFGRENVVCTPHLGAATAEAQENVAVQIAEQIADYVLQGAVSNALNTPSVTAEEAPILKPYVALAEKLGLLAGQLAESALKSVELCFEGAVAELNVKPLVAAATAGVLRPQLDEVNMVSAPTMLKDRGVETAVRTTNEAGAYDALIRVTLVTENGARTVAGSLFAGEPRVTSLRGVDMDTGFTPHMLFTANDDKPGFIGALGAALGEAGVNIATFALGRTQAGGDALALLAVDEAVDDATLKAVRALPHVRQAKALRF